MHDIEIPVRQLTFWKHRLSQKKEARRRLLSHQISAKLVVETPNIGAFHAPQIRVDPSPNFLSQRPTKSFSPANLTLAFVYFPPSSSSFFLFFFFKPAFYSFTIPFLFRSLPFAFFLVNYGQSPHYLPYGIFMYWKYINN